MSPTSEERSKVASAMEALSTGEQADYECSEHIMHCSKCNAEFGYVLYSEDRGVSMYDKPNYCPNCGARCVPNIEHTCDGDTAYCPDCGERLVNDDDACGD